MGKTWRRNSDDFENTRNSGKAQRLQRRKNKRARKTAKRDEVFDTDNNSTDDRSPAKLY